VAKPGRHGDTIVVTGATGQIGYDAVRELAPLGRVVGLTRAELDLAHPAAIRETMRALRPRVIVNAAGYTAVDSPEREDAELERAACRAANAEGPAVLAEQARELGALLVHYSTDYVFNGRKTAPYVETDSPDPLSYYGRTKRDGEVAIESAGGDYIILRTSWVYGLRGKNFLRTMLRLSRERRELRVVNDQVGTPTWSRSIAEMTAAIIRRELTGDGNFAGLYHLSAAGSTTWYEFACCILDADPQREEQIRPVVTPISSREYGAPAERPAYSVLDCRAIRDRFGLALPDWREQLALVLSELRAGTAG
jgi:dTDP-4-dehydrorhamnose reductase